MDKGLWGWIFHEWRGSGRNAHALIATGVTLLIPSTIIIGWGTFLKAQVGAN